MSRVIAALACGFALAGCSMAMPSLEFFRSAPPTETLRVESEPPGADARTSQGQSCRTPCELTVPAGGDMSVSFALNGFQPQTLQVRSETQQVQGYAESSGPARLQPNPVYAELLPMRAPPTKKKRVVKKKQTAQKNAPDLADPPPPARSDPNPAGFSWPDPAR